MLIEGEIPINDGKYNEVDEIYISKNFDTFVFILRGTGKEFITSDFNAFYKYRSLEKGDENKYWHMICQWEITKINLYTSKFNFYADHAIYNIETGGSTDGKLLPFRVIITENADL